jgi:tetratricopeptide (TPR) repeat protein
MKSLAKVLVSVFLLFGAVSSVHAQNYEEYSQHFFDGLYAMYCNEYLDAIEYFSKELKDNPNSIDALILISNCYNSDASKEYKKALSYTGKAINILAKADVDDDIKSSVYASRGYSYIQLGEFDKAIECYSKAIGYSPDEPDFYMYRADCYLELNKYDLFEIDCKTIVLLDPSNITAYMYLGSISGMKEDNAKAIEYYSKVIEIDNEFSPAYARRGAFYYAIGEKEESVDDMIKALDLADEQASNFLLNKSAVDTDYLNLIVDKMKAKNDENPDNPTWLYWIGMIYENNGLYKEALHYYEKVYEKVYEISELSPILEIIEEVKKKIE